MSTIIVRHEGVTHLHDATSEIGLRRVLKLYPHNPHVSVTAVFARAAGLQPYEGVLFSEDGLPLCEGVILKATS